MAAIAGIAFLNLDFDVRVKSAPAESAGDGWSPTQAAPELDVYYPGTEALRPDEMRIVS